MQRFSLADYKTEAEQFHGNTRFNTGEAESEQSRERERGRKGRREEGRGRGREGGEGGRESESRGEIGRGLRGERERERQTADREVVGEGWERERERCETNLFMIWFGFWVGITNERECIRKPRLYSFAASFYGECFFILVLFLLYFSKAFKYAVI